MQAAADDVNIIRKRAHCTKLYEAKDMNLGIIFDERARELMFEELRHVEMVRASYIFAKQGKQMNLETAILMLLLLDWL